MKDFCYYVIFLSVFCVEIISGFPSDVKQCHIEDNACIVSTTNEVIRNGANGNKELGLPALEPFKVNTFVVSDSQKDSSIGLDLTFNDVEFHGLSKTIVEKVVGFEADPTKSKFEFYGVVPRFALKAKYVTKGRILILPIEGNGDADIVGIDVKVSVKFKPTVNVKDGKRYLENVKVKLLLEPSSMEIKLENLFNGDKTLGENMNRFLNENWKDVWAELSSNVSTAFSGVVTDILTKIFEKISYDDFFAS